VATARGTEAALGEGAARLLDDVSRIVGVSASSSEGQAFIRRMQDELDRLSPAKQDALKQLLRDRMTRRVPAHRL